MKLLKDALIMRIHVASVSGGEVTDVSVTINEHTPIVEFANGDYVVFDWQELIEQAIKFKKKEKKLKAKNERA